MKNLLTEFPEIAALIELISKNQLKFNYEIWEAIKFWLIIIKIPHRVFFKLIYFLKNKLKAELIPFFIVIIFFTAEIDLFSPCLFVASISDFFSIFSHFFIVYRSAIIIKVDCFLASVMNCYKWEKTICKNYCIVKLFSIIFYHSILGEKNVCKSRKRIFPRIMNTQWMCT